MENTQNLPERSLGDRSLADGPDLHYTSAAELLFLIETLEAPR